MVGVMLSIYNQAMTDGNEGVKIERKSSDELVKQIRAVNAVLGMDVLPTSVTEGVAVLDADALSKKYPVRFQVYQEVSKYIRESVGGSMQYEQLSAHSKRVSEWRHRIFEGDRPEGYISIGEFLDVPKYSDREWNRYPTRTRTEIFKTVRNKLEGNGAVGVEATIKGYNTTLYRQEDLEKVAEQMP